VAKVVLASALARWLPAGVVPADGEFVADLPGNSVGEALEALFVDGDALQPKSDLGRALRADAEVYVMQALSGG